MYHMLFSLRVVTRPFLVTSSLALAWAIALPLALAEDKAPAKKGQTFMGRIEGATEDCQLAVVIDGKNVLAYICSADEKFNNAHSRWFRGTCTEGKIAAASPDGTKLTGERDGEKVAVSVKEEDATLKADLSQIEPGTEVGLWRAVIKLGDGSELVVGYMVRQGKGSLDDRLSGRAQRRSRSSKLGKLGQLGRSRFLTLSRRNCKIKKANLLQLNVQDIAADQQDAIDVAAAQVDAVAADDQAAADQAAADEAAAQEAAKEKEKEKSKKKKKAAAKQ